MARPQKSIRPKPKMRSLPVTDKATELFAQIMPIGDGARPSAINASFYPCGDFRRIEVSYPNGWRMRVNFNVKGDITSTSAHVRMASTVRGNRAQTRDGVLSEAAG